MLRCDAYYFAAFPFKLGFALFATSTIGQPDMLMAGVCLAIAASLMLAGIVSSIMQHRSGSN